MELAGNCSSAVDDHVTPVEPDERDVRGTEWL